MKNRARTIKFLQVFVVAVAAIVMTACASNRSSNQAEENQESKYASTLPAMQADAGVSESDESEGQNREAPEREYGAQFVLEEEVIASADQSSPPSQADSEPAYSASNEAATQAQSIDIANTFTLQLAAVSTMESAVDYARQYDIESENAGVARILSRGQIFYVLAYGVYTSYEQAELASIELQAKGLPEPWIRRLSAIEQLSKDAQESGL